MVFFSGFKKVTKWVAKKVVKPVVASVVEVADTVGDFVDGALEAGGNFIQGLASTKFKSSGTLDGTSGKDILVGLEFKSIGKFLELSFTTLFSKEFWTEGKIPGSVAGFSGSNSSSLTLNGHGGDDTIFSFGGSVTQNGGTGDDRLLALGGITYLNGGAGADFIVGASLVKNTITGGSGNDVIIALGAVNYIQGGDGNDIITAFGFGNEISGDNGDDVIVALGGANLIWGGRDDDILIAAGGANFLRGNEGDDVIAGAGPANFLFGGGGMDIIVAIGTGNFIYGDADEGDVFGSGNGSNEAIASKDIIVSFGTGNFVWAEGGNDIVTSFGGGTFADGGAGDDIVVAIGGGNAVFGGAGDDVLVGAGLAANVISGQDGDDIIVSMSALDLSFGGDGDDILISAGVVQLGFQMGGSGQDIIAGLGGAIRIQFGDDPFTVAEGGDGDDDAKTAGLIDFAVETFNGFDFTDFEFEDLSLPTMPVLDDLDSGVIGALEGFVLGTWEGLKGVFGRLGDIPDLVNGNTLSLDRLETSFTEIDLPSFSKPDFANFTLDVLNPFGLEGVSFDALDNLAAPRSPGFDDFDLEIDRFSDIDADPDLAFTAQSIFTPESGGSDIALPDLNALLPNLSTGFNPASVSDIADYFPGEDLDVGGLPNLGFADVLSLDIFTLPDAAGLLEDVTDINLPTVETLAALGTTLTGLFDFSKGTGFFQPGEGRGDFSLPDLSFPALSIPSFDLFDPVEGDDSDILLSIAGASLLFGQEDDDIVVGGGFANLLFGGTGSDIVAGVAKGNLISGGEDDDIAVGVGLLNLVSGGPGSDILGAAGKANIVAGGTDGDIILAGGLANLLLGGSGADLIGGGGKLNVIAAGADNDILLGGGKFNVALAGAGDDLAIGGGTFNAMFGGVGNDIVGGGGKFNFGFAGEGNDILIGAGKINTLDGDIGDDLVIGGGQFNTLFGRGGNDALVGGGKFNTFIGGQGTDLLLGGGKFNTFMSGTEADTDELDHDILVGGGKYNTFFAGGGDDLAFVGGSLNHVYLGTGQDIAISYSQGLNMVFAQEDADLVFGAGIGNVYSGGTGNDLLFGFGRDQAEEGGDTGGSINADIKSDGSVTLLGDWGNDLLIGLGEATEIKGGDGQDKLLAAGALNVLKGEAGYDSLISMLGLSALDGGSGNDVIYSKGTTAGLGLSSVEQIFFDGGDLQGGKGSDLIWANGLDIEIFGDVGVSIFSPEEAPEGATRDTQDGDDYIVVSGQNSETYGQGGDDAIVLFGANHRALGGAGDDLLLALGPDIELRGDDGDDELINLGGKLARSQGGAGDDLVIGKGFGLLGWLDDRGGDVGDEFADNILLFAQNIGELITSTISSVGSFREFDGSQIKAEAIYTGRDGLGEVPNPHEPNAADIRQAEAEATSSHIFALIDEYGKENLGSFLSEVSSGNVAAFAPSYDTLAGDVTQAADVALSPAVLARTLLGNIGLLSVADYVAASALAPIYRGGSDDDVLFAGIGLTSLMGGSGNDAYTKSVGERVTIIDEALEGGLNDSLTIEARATDILSFMEDGFDLNNLTFERIDGRNDGTADDLLIRVLSDAGVIRSVTVVLDQYLGDSQIELLTLRHWDGSEQSFDLLSLMPDVETVDAQVDATELAELVTMDEDVLDELLLANDAYAQMFLFDGFDIDETVGEAGVSDFDALTTSLDTYFQTLGDGTDGAASLADGKTIEEILDGEAFEDAPVLEVVEGAVTQTFDDGALLSVFRFVDGEGIDRYETSLTSNGSSEGFKDLNAPDDAGFIVRAIAREDVDIQLAGRPGHVPASQVEEEFESLGGGTGFFYGPGFNEFMQLLLDPVDGADLETPILLQGTTAPSRKSALVLREEDLNGLAIELDNFHAISVVGAVDLTVSKFAQVSVADDDTAAQTIRMVGESTGSVELGDGENVFDLQSLYEVFTSTFTGGLDQDTYILHLDGFSSDNTLFLEDVGGTGDIYRFVSSGLGEAFGGNLELPNKATDIIDLSQLAADVIVMPLSDGLSLQSEYGQMDIFFENLSALPSILWDDGILRPMIDFFAGETATQGADTILVDMDSIGGDVEGLGGDDVIISNNATVRILPGLGDDIVQLHAGFFTDVSRIEWSGGNDHYSVSPANSAFTSFPSVVKFTLGQLDDYGIGVGHEAIDVTYLPTGEVTRIEGTPTIIEFEDASLSSAQIADQIAHITRVTDEDVPFDVFADMSGVELPSGAVNAVLRIDAEGGAFETADGLIVTSGDSLSVADFLSLRFVPDGNFNSDFGPAPVLEADFRTADGAIQGALDVTIDIKPVDDILDFGIVGYEGQSSVVVQEGDVPAEGLQFYFNDFDQRYSDVDITINLSTDTGTGVVTFPGGIGPLPDLVSQSMFFLEEQDNGVSQINLNVLRTVFENNMFTQVQDSYTVELVVEAVDDLETFANIPDEPTVLGENTTAPLTPNLSTRSDDNETGIYELVYTYSGGDMFVLAFWDSISGTNDRIHPNGAILTGGSYESDSGLASNRLIGTMEQINAAVSEVRVGGLRNFEGDTTVEHELFKVEADGALSLQDSFTHDVTFTKGVNRVTTERTKIVYLTQDEDPVDVNITDPFDADFALDEQPVFPVRIFRLPEFGHLETPDGEIITLEFDNFGNLRQYDSDVLTSLLYVPDADAPNDPTRDYAYEDFIKYQVLNPAGPTTLGQSTVIFRVFDDRVTEDIDDGAGGIVTRPVGFDWFDFGESNSVFYGGDGNDTISPFGGIDLMLGGLGADTFIIDEDSGEFNAIGDFEVGVDTLVLGALSVVDITEQLYFQDVELGITDDTMDTVLSLSNGAVLVLDGVTNFTDTQNIAPTGVDDSFSVEEHTVFADEAPFLTGNVLDNDSDFDGDQIFVDLDQITNPRKGNLVIQADGNFTYEPYQNRTGADQFQYTPTDGEHAGRTVTVNIEILDAPNNGSDAADLLEALSGDTTLAGNGGADTLIGAEGDDLLIGGYGNDQITTGAGNDTISGDRFEMSGDKIADFTSDDVLLLPETRFAELELAQFGDDLMLTINGYTSVLFDGLARSSKFLQTLTQDGLEIRLIGEQDAQSVLSDGEDRLIAGGQSVTVYADTGNDAVAGSGEGDFLFGENGDDVLFGGAGNDVLVGGRGHNVLVGGAGADIFAFDPSNSQNQGDFNIIRDFTPGEDIIELSGFGFADIEDLHLYQRGDGVVIGATGRIALADISLDELNNSDFRFLATGLASEVIGLENALSLTSEGEKFVVTSANGTSVNALSGDDEVIGGDGDDHLIGGSGDDTLLGRGGEDTLSGGSGDNTLTGGDGADEFVLRHEAGATRDLITDFELGLDRIVLDGLAGIATLEDAVRRDTDAGLELDFGNGRVLVLSGFSSSEEFEATDIVVIAAPDQGPSNSAPVTDQPRFAQAANDGVQELEVQAWSVSVGAFDALQFGAQSFATLSGPHSVTFEDDDLVISPETADQTNITIDGDDQGAITDLRYVEINWQNADGVSESATVAVIERAVTADYLLLPVNTQSRTLSADPLPDGVVITVSSLGPDFDGEVALISDVEQNGGILARDDRFEIAPNTSITFDVLANDALIGDAMLQITSVSEVSHGVVSVVDNAIHYTAKQDFFGVVYLDYGISDGADRADTGQVRIDVIPEGYTALEGAPGSPFYNTQAPELILGRPESDLILGIAEHFDGDIVTEFGLEDRLTLFTPGLKVIGMDVTSVRTVFEITDTALTDTSYEVTLQGDYTGETFRFSNRPNNLDIRLTGEGGVLLTQGGDRFVTTSDNGSTVFGAGGDDVIVTSSSGDILSGGAGNDVLAAGEGRDFLFSGTGLDNLTGGDGPDTFFFDVADFEGDELVAKFITDYEPGVDEVEISGFGFTEYGELNFISLATGDAVQLSPTQFIVFEGVAQDQILAEDFRFAEAGRAFTLASSPVVNTLTDAADRFVTTDDGPNDVRSGAGIDAVIGGAGDDILRGEAGDDVLIGGAGSDRLIGGQGADRLTGRDGADSFEFTAGEETTFVAEFITDYEAEDAVVIIGFGYGAVEDLSFFNAVNGDLVLTLTDTRFVVFEGLSDQDQLTGTFEFG